MSGRVLAKLAFVLLAGLAFFLLSPLCSFGGQSSSQPSKANSRQDTYSPPTDPSLYVGEETCKTCHQDMPSKGFVERFESSRHFVTTLDSKKGPQWQGCEACHGPGKAHVDGGGDKAKIFKFETASTKEINARCLTCHAG